ncbi:MFS general substrate transporter [Dichomitus squalens]|uniref:MFS general substrate transporter n=1 Tax=Dichomitus squalens TaxID=114155 RepID=A0A4Q9MM59_9APHY|nr:MFS general substrate transporter [Dichomitus squalens]
MPGTTQGKKNPPSQSQIEEQEPEKGEIETQPVESEVEQAPHQNLRVVIPTLLLNIFMPALDQTITAVALPSIIDDIGGSEGYSWIGAAYLLASAACAPSYGRFSDVIGRKPVFITSWFLFLLGSALCGSARNITWLAICRGVQGAGGGGIITLSMIAISDITPLARRGLYIGLVGTVWGAASVVGPTIGGVFSDTVSWRWCFYINLPVGGALALVVLAFLRLKPAPKKSLSQALYGFDYIGLLLVFAATSCLIVGLQLGKSAWSDPSTITLLVLGVVLFSSCALYECFTRRTAIIPPRIFRDRTASAVLLGAALHGFALFSGSYYIPVYFQAQGLSAANAGVRTMGFSLVSSATGSIAGLITTTQLGYRPVIWVSWMLAAIGYGLLIMANDETPRGLQELYIIIAGAGIGGLFQVPMIALHASMPRSDMAAASAVFMLFRLVGSSIGVSVGDTIFTNEVRKRLASIPDYVQHGRINTDDLRALSSIQPESLRRVVLHAYASSLSDIWIVVTALLGVGFLLSVLISKHPLEQHTLPQTQSTKDVPTPAAEKE